MMSLILENNNNNNYFNHFSSILYKFKRKISFDYYIQNYWLKRIEIIEK